MFVHLNHDKSKKLLQKFCKKSNKLFAEGCYSNCLFVADNMSIGINLTNGVCIYIKSLELLVKKET